MATKTKITGGFETFPYADINTAHVSENDQRLVTREGEDLPGVLAQYKSGWFIYVPEDDFAAHQEELEEAGFSKHYILVVTALFLNQIPYARFDADGATHPRLRIFGDD